jgi:hypothetical protein
MAQPVNYEHLAAEIAAWPFASVTSFRLTLESIEKSETGAFTPRVEALSKEMIERLQWLARGLSIEVLTQLRDSIWFESPERSPSRTGPRRCSLLQLVFQMATERLKFSGRRVLLRPTPAASLEDVVHRWRWSSLTLPSDFLIAAYAAQQGKEPVANHVSLGAPELDKFFEKYPLAQVHLHLGAAVPFERLWTRLMSGIGGNELQPKRLAEGAGFEGPREFLSWLVTAALARLSLASFLEHREQGMAEPFAEFLLRLASRGRRADLHWRAMTALARGEHPVSFAELRPVLRNLEGPPAGDEDGASLLGIAKGDPLFEWLGEGDALPETRFMTRAMRFLYKTDDPEFALLFWQYVRIRNLTYRHLVLPPGIAGLDWFSRSFSRLSPLRLGLDDRARVASALELESRGARLASLEVRTTPPAQWWEVRALALDVRSAPVHGKSDTERGLVLHMRKERRGKRREHADPRQLGHGCRFGSYFHARQREMMALEKALRLAPHLLQTIRGLDVCHLELAVPTWVFVPLLLHIRAVSREIVSTAGPRSGLQPLQLTMHAGEEFRRLTEGLRLIHEPIEAGLVASGDRLGHAVALGVDPKRWCSATPFSPQPMEEYLDDLLWEETRYRAQEMRPLQRRRAFVKQEIERLSRWIYGEQFLSLDDLLASRRLRHDPVFLSTVGYPFMRSAERGKEWGKAGELALRYLSDFTVYARGRHAERVTTHSTEAAMLTRAQVFLRSTLSKLKVTVEANPTSNILIGELNLDEHPVFRLQPLTVGERGIRVPVALGSDDPVTFATCLPDELSYTYYALRRRGVKRGDAQRWLARLIQNGMKARFTLPKRAQPKRT